MPKVTVDQLLAIGEPLARIRAIDEAAEALEDAGAELRRMKGQAIRDLRGEGKDRRTWEAIGKLLGVSAQRAEQLSRV